MYEIDILEELDEIVYTNLIEYAIKKSDVFMIVTWRLITDIESAFSLPDRNDFESDEEYSDAVNFTEEAKAQRYKDEKIFKKFTKEYLEKLEPFLIKKRNFPTEWPGTMVELNKDMSVDIGIYKACSNVKDYLLEPKGLFNWRYPYFPEDLCFFKEHKCWFYTVAHEGYASIYVNNIDDVNKIKKTGLKFEISQCNENEVNLFYENYNI